MHKHRRDETPEFGSSFEERCYNLDDPEKLKLELKRELNRQALETHPILLTLFDDKRKKVSDESINVPARASARAVAKQWGVELSTLIFYFPASRDFFEALERMSSQFSRKDAVPALFEACSKRLKKNNETPKPKKWLPKDVKVATDLLQKQGGVPRSAKRARSAAKILNLSGPTSRIETPCRTRMSSPGSDEDPTTPAASLRQSKSLTPPTVSEPITVSESPPSSKDIDIFDMNSDILKNTQDASARVQGDALNEAVRLLVAPYVSIRAMDSRWYHEADRDGLPFQKLADYFSIAVHTRQKLLTSLHDDGDEHWILALLDPSTAQVQLWDSLQDPDRRQRARRKLSRYFEGISWSFEDVGSAQQEDNIVCGIFVFIFACHLVTETPLPETISPLAVSIWRRVLCHFIANGKGSWALYDSPIAIRYEPEHKSFTSIEEFLAAKKARENYEEDLLQDVRASAARYHDDLHLADMCLERIADISDSLLSAIESTTIRQVPEQLGRFNGAIQLASDKYGGEIKRIMEGLEYEARQINRRLKCLEKVKINVVHVREAISDAKDIIARTRNELEGLQPDTSDNQATLSSFIESQEPSPRATTEKDRILPKSDSYEPLARDSTLASSHVATSPKPRRDSEESSCTTSSRILTTS